MTTTTKLRWTRWEAGRYIAPIEIGLDAEKALLGDRPYFEVVSIETHTEGEHRDRMWHLLLSAPDLDWDGYYQTYRTKREAQAAAQLDIDDDALPA